MVDIIKTSIHKLRWESIKKQVSFNIDTDDITNYQKRKLKKYFDYLTVYSSTPHVVYRPKTKRNIKLARKHLSIKALTELSGFKIPAPPNEKNIKISISESGIRLKSKNYLSKIKHKTNIRAQLNNEELKRGEKIQFLFARSVSNGYFQPENAQDFYDLLMEKYGDDDDFIIGYQVVSFPNKGPRKTIKEITKAKSVAIKKRRALSNKIRYRKKHKK